MKVKLLSDLHLEICEKDGIFHPGEGDVLILAGDILTAKHLEKDGALNKVYTTFLTDCVSNFNHVLYVMGNHEHYGYHFESTYNKIKLHIPDTIHLLENETIQIGDWTFIGMTMWTDFNKESPTDMFTVKQMLNDYQTIRATEKYRKLQPYDVLDTHKASRLYLFHQLKEHRNDNVFVITHHAPCEMSIAGKYKGNVSNCAYYTDFSNIIISNPQIKYWAHGHVHHKNDYMLEQCRIMSNPRGYYGYESIKGYDPDFCIDI
jgi:predicted phosphodiesterase